MNSSMMASSTCTACSILVSDYGKVTGVACGKICVLPQDSNPLEFTILCGTVGILFSIVGTWELIVLVKFYKRVAQLKSPGDGKKPLRRTPVAAEVVHIILLTAARKLESKPSYV